MRASIASLILRAIAFVATPYQAVAQATVAIRELAPVEAKSVAPFGSILGVRHLPGGNVLVNDAGNRQLVVLDATMTIRTVVLDSVATGAQGYGTRAAPIISYLGDSTLFVDPVALSFVVLDPKGKVVRAMAAPNGKDLRLLARGTSGVDQDGNVLYRGDVAMTLKAGTNGAIATRPMYNDTAPVLRANFDRRVVDTVARLKVQSPLNVEETKDASGKWIYRTIVNPLVLIDDWAVLADGSIAIVRGHDYHVDVVSSTGTLYSAPKLPFDFKRLTDEDKQQLLDSLRAIEDKRRAVQPSTVATEQARTASAESRAATAAGVAIARAPILNPQPIVVQSDYVPVSEILDYHPPIRPGAARADADGNLWILPTTSAQSRSGELVYDVVNNRGALMYRVRVPSGRSIAGFGKNGVVYLMSKNSDAGWVLERTRVMSGAN